MRKVHFDEEVWQYKIGRSNIEVRSPNDKKIVISLTYFLSAEFNMTAGDAHKAVFPSHFPPEEKIPMPPIKPSDIKSFIEREIKNVKDIGWSGHIR